MYFTSHIFCCTNQREAGHPRGCCKDKGSEPLRDYMKERCKALNLPQTRINSAGCLDRCELGPVMVIYPEGTWYNYQSKEDIDEIIDTHLVGGGIVERLELKDGQKRL
jgi:(2Fe-2S) ferredoxin